MEDLLSPIPFHCRRLLLLGHDFSCMVAKSDEFRHTFFKCAQPAGFRPKSEFTGREMYANGRNREAEVRGLGR